MHLDARVDILVSAVGSMVSRLRSRRSGADAPW
ncbi:hypothetical protein OCAE111667_03900 [Occultella aeris]|uniref:Uncharacterized protein n=1 Tax=Occultella aeris TaxID=2761496 RepID=A0A7M4DDR1_9MICO|nr:hypothetical protein HALOF300_00250 [Occultella aeris]